MICGTFKRRRKSAASPARAVLVEAAQQVAQAKVRLAEGEAVVGRLNEVIATAAAATKMVVDAVTADRAATLGQPGAPLNALLDEADSAGRAAAVARSALPSAEGEVEKARRELTEAEAAHNKAIDAAVVAAAKPLVDEYLAVWRRLAELHDQLQGIGRVVAGFALRAPEAIEFPRFAPMPLPFVPSLQGPHAAVYSPYLRHEPQLAVIAASAARWAASRAALAGDPQADVASTLAEPVAPEAPQPARMLKQRPATAQEPPAGNVAVQVGPRTTAIVPAGPPRERPAMRHF